MRTFKNFVKPRTALMSCLMAVAVLCSSCGQTRVVCGTDGYLYNQSYSFFGNTSQQLPTDGQVCVPNVDGSYTVKDEVQ